MRTDMTRLLITKGEVGAIPFEGDWADGRH